jgi:tetratricopeptide (TPR) repeat protein
VNDLYRRIARWVKTRRRSRFLWGLPAALACGVWIVFALFLAGWGSAHTEARYRELADRALATKDYETARVAFWRLMQLERTQAKGPEKGEQRREYMFRLALSMLGLGRGKEAQALLMSLAPLDGQGYAPAHLYIARAVLSQTNVPPAAMRVAEAHLLSTLVVEPGSVDAKEMLGHIYLRWGLWESAKKHLLDVVKERSDASLPLAYVLKAQGDENQARAYAERAAQYFAGKVGESGADVPRMRMAWAEALVMLKEYETALAVLETGVKESSAQVYGPAIAGVCAAWVQSLTPDSARTAEARLKLVQQGLQFDPRNEVLLKELVSLTRQSGKAADTARAAITRLLSEGGKDTASLHFFLGLDAWEHGDKEKARQHMDLAYETDRLVPTVANNMAMVLISTDTPDYERALSLVEPIIAKFPDNPNFRDTRGLIYLKQGRYREAITDLEFALPRLPSKAGTHAALAEAYEKLGLKDLAEEHRRRAPGPGAAPSSP